MSINTTEKSLTVEELHDSAAEIVKQLHDNGQPVVITAQGERQAILLKIDHYEQMVHLLNLGRLLSEAETAIQAGKTRPADDFFKELLTEQSSAKKTPRRNRSRS
jgi:PHD/YefM family antitoxin component YafN of YafNO toxin-antitoxin module